MSENTNKEQKKPEPNKNQQIKTVTARLQLTSKGVSLSSKKETNDEN